MNLTIKQFAERFGVSHRLVRYYDDIGLLHPSMRHSNGYRGYNEDDLERFKRIIVLKRIGFSLKDIKALVEGEAKLADMLPQRLSSLQEEIPRIQNAIECIDRLMHRDPDDDNWKWCAKKMGIVV